MCSCRSVIGEAYPTSHGRDRTVHSRHGKTGIRAQPRTNLVEDESVRSRIVNEHPRGQPDIRYERWTHGRGAMRVASPASKAVAPTVPSRSYICPAKRGKTAANVDRTALLAAIALAAIGRYAVTRYVNTAVKMNTVPAPNGIEPMIGPIQCTCLYVVKAMMKSPNDMSEECSVNGIRRRLTYWRENPPDLARYEPHFRRGISLQGLGLLCEESVPERLRREGNHHAQADTQEA